jgi:hypothetical protein
MINSQLKTTNGHQANEFTSRTDVYCDLKQLVSDFAFSRCANRPAWSGQISDLHATSHKFFEMNKVKFTKFILDLNESNLIPEYEFWYQEYTESLIILNKTHTGNWNKLSNYFHEHQQFLKLLKNHSTRTILFQLYKDKYAIERLFFENKVLSSPIDIQELAINNINCSAYQVNFKSSKSIVCMTRTFDFEQNTIHLTQLLGFFEIQAPVIIQNSKCSWFKSTQGFLVSCRNNDEYLDYKLGLLFSLIYTFESKHDLLSIILQIKQSPFYSFIFILLNETIKEGLHQNEIPTFLLENRVEKFIDGFTCGYRKILSRNYTNKKLLSYSKLIPGSFLTKLANQIPKPSTNNIHQKCSVIMSEEDLSNQIGLIRQKYCISKNQNG